MSSLQSQLAIFLRLIISFALGTVFNSTVLQYFDCKPHKEAEPDILKKTTEQLWTDTSVMSDNPSWLSRNQRFPREEKTQLPTPNKQQSLPWCEEWQRIVMDLEEHLLPIGGDFWVCRLKSGGFIWGCCMQPEQAHSFSHRIKSWCLPSGEMKWMEMRQRSGAWVQESHTCSSCCSCWRGQNCQERWQSIPFSPPLQIT